MQQSKKIIYFFALVKCLIPFLLIYPAFELHRDEYLYLADAAHLSWGYIEMPPLLALMGAISKWMGNGFYTVYFWDGLLGGLTVLVVGNIVLQLKGNITAVYIACISFLFSVFLRMHILFQPNILDVFFWTLSAYIIILWIDTNHKKYLYFLGISFGLGILSKYTIAFFIAAFLIGVLLTDKRKWLLNIHFYMAMLLALLIASPNIYWQYSHHLPVLHHMQLLKDRQLQYLSRVQFMKDQLTITLPCFFIWILGVLFLFFSKEGRKHILIGWIYVFVMLLLLWQHGKNYYAASIYPVLMAVGAVYFERLLHQIKSVGVKRTLQLGVTLIIIILGSLFLPLMIPFKSAPDMAKLFEGMHLGNSVILTWEDGKVHPLPQDYADMQGWREMTEKTAKAYHSLPDSIQKDLVIFGNNYGEAGALNFFGKQYQLPEVIGDDASFAFWIPDSLSKKHLLLVDFKPRKTTDFVFSHFHSMEILDSVTNPYAREKGVKIMLYGQGDDSLIIASKIAIKELKQQYNLH